MLLDTTSKSIQFKIEGASTTTEPTFNTTYADITQTNFSPGSTDGSANGSTAVTVIPSPAAAMVYRHVKELVFFNADTVSHVFTVWLLDGANSYNFGAFTLLTGQSLTYSAGSGWLIDAFNTTPVSANPSAVIGLTAVNGSAATFMTSDSAPRLNQAIVPTWTGIHTFNAETIFGALFKVFGDTTGAVTATLGTNAPSIGTTPYTWIKMISSDGSTVYCPAFK